MKGDAHQDIGKSGFPFVRISKAKISKLHKCRECKLSTTCAFITTFIVMGGNGL